MENSSEIVFYTSPAGDTKIEVIFRDETVWLTQKKMAELFDVSIPNINMHLKGVFDSGELDQNSVIKEFLTTAHDRKNYQTKFYSLDAIISVGYRVNSQKATQFRIWATKTLREFIIKGFVMDDERLKNGQHFGKDYFEELLERIREIRSSERRFYQKITDIYSLSVDYNKNTQITKDFFATVQNKLHWAITGQTAAEIIYSHANATKKYMGLTSWKHSPKRKIFKSDVVIAKNYLSKTHIKELEQIVSAYLDLAENRAKRGILMKMADWTEFLNRFLEVAKYPVLVDKGKVSKLQAELKASKQYEKFRVVQDKQFVSDFDEATKKLLVKPRHSGANEVKR